MILILAKPIFFYRRSLLLKLYNPLQILRRLKFLNPEHRPTLVNWSDVKTAWAVAIHICNCSTLEEDTGGSLSLRSTGQQNAFQDSKGYTDQLSEKKEYKS